MVDLNTKEVLVVDTILEKHLVGTINEADIQAKSTVQDVSPESLNAEQCMRPITLKVRETTSIEECDRLLEEHKIEHLAIVDEYGHLCGVYNPAGLLPIRQ